jgi:UDP-N-acetylglucosamine 2-epimerase
MKKTLKIVTVVGARPQFVKAAALSRAFAAFNKQSDSLCFEEQIVHTGQHYDENMSKVFFDQLHIPYPSINLEVGSGTHGRQSGVMLEKIESILLESRPDWVLIYGDTNSTLAAALAAVKIHIPVAHIEAGLRSFNRQMPEEINRVVADHLSTFLFCPTETAVYNLADEGITKGVHQVGDVMYDSVLFNIDLAERSSTILEQLSLDSKSYYLATIHRAENTDNKDRLKSILDALDRIDMPILLPMHPRTKNTLGAKLDEIGSGVRIIDPVSYLDMLMLEKNARVILTDSGGVQKEAYWANVPCITLRDETEWTELVTAGYNRVVGSDTSAILDAVSKAENEATNNLVSNRSKLYGDGHSAEKIVAILGEQVN